MSELVQAARFLLLGALFLFLYRVVRAVGEDLQQAADPAPWAVLVVEEGPGLAAGEAFAFRGQATLGTGPPSDLHLPDPAVQPQHLRVVAHREGFWVEDLGSSSGTYLNGRRLEAPAPLRHGDRLQVGSTVLRFVQPHTRR